MRKRTGEKSVRMVVRIQVDVFCSQPTFRGRSRAVYLRCESPAGSCPAFDDVASLPALDIVGER